jgi:6,7-dimethyl-8-ribityllumazine synthase
MYVPGAYDMPLAIKKMLKAGSVDAIVTIGCVIEGATQHDEIVVQHAARKIIDLSLEFEKPVSLGISGPGMTRVEASERIDYARRAVESAVKMVQRLG